MEDNDTGMSVTQRIAATALDRFENPKPVAGPNGGQRVTVLGSEFDAMAGRVADSRVDNGVRNVGTIGTLEVQDRSDLQPMPDEIAGGFGMGTDARTGGIVSDAADLLARLDAASE